MRLRLPRGKHCWQHLRKGQCCQDSARSSAIECAMNLDMNRGCKATSEVVLKHAHQVAPA